jgi:MFS family permease
MSHIHFPKAIKAFFATKLTHQVRELYLSAGIVNFAVAMVAIFEPIYLYSRGFSLSQVLYFYLVIYSVYFFTIPLGAKFARRFGYEKAILLGTPFLALYYISLYLIASDVLFIGLAIFAFAASKTFYWPGFHADFARFGKGKERGREVSNIIIVVSMVAVAGPFVGGLIISIWGFNILFTIATILILSSNLPLLSTPEKFKPTPFSYKESFTTLFAKGNRRNFFGFIGYGEEFLGMVIWPIFIFIIVKDFLSIGSLVALSTLTTTLVVLFVGRMVDSGNSQRRSILKIGSIFKSGAWLLRILVQGTLGVFLVDSMSRITKNVIVVPMMAMTYDRANETSVMKTIIFFEQALIIGKLVAIGLSLIALTFISDSFAALFVIGAIMTLLYSLVRYDPIKLRQE